VRPLADRHGAHAVVVLDKLDIELLLQRALRRVDRLQKGRARTLSRLSRSSSGFTVSQTNQLVDIYAHLVVLGVRQAGQRLHDLVAVLLVLG